VLISELQQEKAKKQSNSDQQLLQECVQQQWLRLASSRQGRPLRVHQ
jgi:hypothetical protein